MEFGKQRPLTAFLELTRRVGVVDIVEGTVFCPIEETFFCAVVLMCNKPISKLDLETKIIQRTYGNERDEESAPVNRETDIEVPNGGVLGGVSGTGVDMMSSTDLTSLTRSF